MDRATKKGYNPCGGCYYGCDYEVGESDNPCETVNGYNRAVLLEDILGDDYDLDRLREALEKQAEYEQFMEKWKQVAEIAGAVKKVGAERAAELVEAYRDGRCFCAPLKPGDIVMCIWYGRPTQNKVERINFYWVGDGIDWYAITTSTTGSKECFGKEEWGKTVFPTYEAAEAALKGKQYE